MTQEHSLIINEIASVENRLHLTFPSSFRTFLQNNAGKLAPVDSDISAGLWLCPDELITGDHWSLFDGVSEEDFKDGDVSKLIVIHQSHNHQYFLVLNYRFDEKESGLLLLRKEKIGVDLVQQFVSFDEFLEVLDRHPHFKAVYLPINAE